MARYRVTWGPEAGDDLADLWTAVPNRQAVTDAADEIDRLLASDPLGFGSAVAEGLRKLSVPTLTVYFSVNQDDVHVEVSNLLYTP
jgi:hypothetical protein